MIEQEELDEIIFVDGGSTDGSLEYLKELSQLDSRIKILSLNQKFGSGASAARNLGITQASSEWITFCDIDDYYLAGRFALFAKADKEGVDLFHTSVQAAYTSDHLKNSIQEITSVPKGFSAPIEMQDYLISQSAESISIISTIIRKEALMKVGLFDESLSIGEDTDLLWRLSGQSTFKYENLDIPRVIRQVHEDNTYQNKDRLIKGRLAFYKKWRSSQEYKELRAPAQKRIREGHRHYRYVNGYENGKGLSSTTELIKYLWSRLLRT